ncbi:MAG: phosphoribosylanthranilate isomerase [Deltaproteobacteria bacterium]|uniref:N-(5'-phosphoribosyl)anthranilate isomerase n=1 Tax=Candidatus Zymogenus saltonus TaxID=2844893 RepID=A0A9D8KIH8_9DELT|nr:phosphoribosylanthranilate isomerase [Candidatus Zymogenus saltonus]
MGIRIKICGITNDRDALAAARLGADALGFIFYPKSPRFVTPEAAEEIVRGLPPFISTVGVFVDEPVELIARTAEMCCLNAVQIYPEGPNGPDEFPDDLPFRVIRAIRVKDAGSLELISSYKKGTTFLLDTYRPGAHGGTGISFDWGLVKKYIPDYRIIIAGGLNAENVGRVVGEYAPYGVDAASGVEKEPGVKDHQKLDRFITNAQIASLNEASLNGASLKKAQLKGDIEDAVS